MNQLFSTQRLSIINKDCLLIKFLYGKFYPILIGLSALISYITAFPYFALTVFVIFACANLLLIRDLTPFMILPMAVIILFRNFSFALHPYCIVLYACVAVCLIAHFIIYPPKQLKGKLYLPFLAITCALFLGGIGSEYISSYSNGLVFAFITGPFLMLVYFIFTSYIEPPVDFDIKTYFSYVITILAIFIVIEIPLHLYFCSTTIPTAVKGDIGWANINGVATILMFATPFCWYLISKSNRPTVYLILSVIILVGIVLTKSDGCLAITVVSTIILAILSIKKGNDLNKKTLPKKLIITLAILLTIFTIEEIITGGNIISKFYSGLVSGSGRFDLFAEAAWLFSKYPFLGVGLGYVNPDKLVGVDSLHAYNFHSTLFQVGATMGIVGLLAYTYYFVERFNLFRNKKSVFNLFALIAFIVFEVYGMIDACEFTIMPQMLILTIMLVVVEKTNKRGNEKPPPLEKL